MRSLVPLLGLALVSCDPPPAATVIEPPAVEEISEPPTTAPLPGSSGKGDVGTLISWLLDDSRQLEGVAFSEVVRATAGKEILPIDPEGDPVSGEIAEALGKAMKATMARLNRDDSPVRGLGRINEASRYFEDEMQIQLEGMEGFTCGIPPLADGTEQRSGYPDLRLVHEASGRIAYIDPKLFEDKSIKSSLRTFYFEPKVRTNKVLDDAHHILVGIAHDGNDGKWEFTSWHAVDLHSFKVRLKAEFQASNKDLYSEELIFKGSAK